jgi:hypothetical protein
MDYLIGAGIILSAIPITIGLIYGINWISGTKYAKRFDAWFDSKN